MKLLLFCLLLIYFFSLSYLLKGYIHYEIFKLSCILNHAYSYQILLDLLGKFSVVLCTLYNIYFYLMSLNLSKILLSNKETIGFLI